MKFSVVLTAALFLSAFVSAQPGPTDSVSNSPAPATENPSPSTENPSSSTENPSSSTENPLPSTENPSSLSENPSSSTESYSSSAIGSYSSSAIGSYSSSAIGNYSSSAIGNYSSSAIGNYSSSAIGNYSSSAIGNYSSSAIGNYSSSAIGNYSSSAIGNYSSSAIGSYSSSAIETYPSSPTETYTTSFETGTETYPSPPTQTNPESSGMPTTSASFRIPPSNSTNINVEVAPGDQLTYSNSNFNAPNGTAVTFFFTSNSVSHSATQGSFANPCVSLTPSGGDPAGFDSGLQSDGKEFVLTIANDQIPVWFFCKNSDYCGLGMVGVINAPTNGNSYDKWVAAAKAVGSNEIPIKDYGPVTGGVGAVATSTPSPIPPSLLTSSSTHLVANGFFALLAATFGFAMTLT